MSKISKISKMSKISKTLKQLRPSPLFPASTSLLYIVTDFNLLLFTIFYYIKI